MPSGFCVRISGWNWVDVYMDGIPEDAGQISGICGNFNGDRNDDSSDHEAWRYLGLFYFCVKQDDLVLVNWGN